MRDRLFVLRPGFPDPAKGDGRYFCPFCAQVMGFLSYYPDVRSTLDIIEIDFPRPRARLVELVGEPSQGAPLLVLGDEHPDAAPVPIAEANGYRIVVKTLDILRYLAATRGVPSPH